MLREQFIHLFTDSFFKAPAVESAEFFVKKQVPTYFYQLEIAPKFVLGIPVPEDNGIYHGADIFYTFGFPLVTQKNQTSEIQVRFAKSFMTLWSNFAKTGWVEILELYLASVSDQVIENLFSWTTWIGTFQELPIHIRLLSYRYCPLRLPWPLYLSIDYLSWILISFTGYPPSFKRSIFIRPEGSHAPWKSLKIAVDAGKSFEFQFSMLRKNQHF